MSPLRHESLVDLSVVRTQRRTDERSFDPLRGRPSGISPADLSTDETEPDPFDLAGEWSVGPFVSSPFWRDCDCAGPDPLFSAQQLQAVTR